MKKLYLEYNPYSKKTIFRDETGKSDDWIETRCADSESLESWINDFLDYMFDKYNCDLELEFSGNQRDCETLEDAVNAFNTNKSNKYILKRNEFFNTKGGMGDERLGKVKELYAEIKSDDCPFSGIKEDKEIQSAYEKAVGDEFEIAVVATMSSGKSTLINSMLGDEYLPAKNEATTATIAKIHNNSESSIFSAEVYDKDDNRIDITDELTLEKMQAYNDNPKTLRVEIEGKIVGINSRNMRLVLIDTPGPNNSSSTEHKVITNSIIKAKYKPVVLYILNATQLETEDDNRLLTEIANEMKKGGRQSSERFIFVLNKVDEFDPDKESVEEKIKDTKTYLERHGIKDARIFPCSAYYAKIVRQYMGNKKLTRIESRDANSAPYDFNTFDDMHFERISPVSNSVQAKIDLWLEDAIRSNDQFGQALIHTGLPSIEETITEYLEKYAFPIKISETLLSFKQSLEDTNDEAVAKKELADNEQKRDEVKRAIEVLQKEIDGGEMGRNLKSRIDALSCETEIKEAYEKLRGSKINGYLINEKKKYTSMTDVPIKKAKELCEKVQESLRNFGESFEIDIMNIINESIGNQALKYIHEYNAYVKDLMGVAFTHEVNAASVLGSFAHIHFSSDTIDDYKFEKKEVIGCHNETRVKEKTVMQKEQKTRMVKKDGFFNRLLRGVGSIFDKDWGYDYETYIVEVPVKKKFEVTETVEDYGMVQYVDFSKMFVGVFTPILDDLFLNAEKIMKESALNEEMRLKASFKNQFDELQKKIEEKLVIQKRQLSSKEEFERAIAENEKNLKWLYAIKEKIDDIISA